MGNGEDHITPNGSYYLPAPAKKTRSSPPSAVIVPYAGKYAASAFPLLRRRTNRFTRSSPVAVFFHSARSMPSAQAALRPPVDVHVDLDVDEPPTRIPANAFIAFRFATAVRCAAVRRPSRNALFISECVKPAFRILFISCTVKYWGRVFVDTGAVESTRAVNVVGPRVGRGGSVYRVAFRFCAYISTRAKSLVLACTRRAQNKMRAGSYTALRKTERKTDLANPIGYFIDTFSPVVNAWLCGTFISCMNLLKSVVL